MVLAGVINALRLVKKEVSSCKVVINGCGSAGTAIGKLLLQYGFINLIMVDKEGIVEETENWLNWAQLEMAKLSNPHHQKGTLSDALVDADLLLVCLHQTLSQKK